MKPNLRTAIASLSAILLLAQCALAQPAKKKGAAPPKKVASALQTLAPPPAVEVQTTESILTGHKWTLMEALQTVNDTVTNLQVFKPACEKDDYFVYDSRGTYQKMAGENKCDVSDKDLIGEGTWKFSSQDSSIVDSYEGGKKTWKRILTLNDEVLKVQYEGEAKKVFTLTYFSETGKNNDLNQELIVDNSDPSQNIIQSIKEYLIATNRYFIVSRRDFQKGVQPVTDVKDKALQTVALIPFANSTNQSNAGSLSEKLKTELIEQAKRSGTQYIITGTMFNAKATKAKDGKAYGGTVKYEVNILDVTNGNTFSQIFPESKGSGKENDFNSVMGKIGKVAGRVALGALAVGAALFYSPLYYGYYYNSYFLNNAYQKSADVSSVFSNVNSEVRQNTYDSTQAVLKAVSETVGDVNGFVGEKTPIKIKINRIDGSDKKAEIFIEAGSNIHLWKGEELKVVRVKNMTVGDKTIVKYEELGEISVKEVIADILSSCSFDKGKERDKIIEAYKQTPNDIVILTIGKLPKK